MARQRAIRPEYFRDRVMGKLGPITGTVYQALWVWADDGGVARCDPQVLKGDAFLWWPDITIGDLVEALARLAGAGRIRLYSVEDDLYAEIPTLAKHSPISHPSKFRYPRKGQKVSDVRAWLSGQFTPSALRSDAGRSPESVPSVLPLAVTDTNKGIARAEGRETCPPSGSRLLDALSETLDVPEARAHRDRKAGAA